MVSLTNLGGDTVLATESTPFDCDRNAVINFLQHLLCTSPAIYGTFNSHRSALSLILKQPLGEDQSIKRYLRGIYKMRPPKPKYNTTWDPQVILQYPVETLPVLDLKTISEKLVLLFFLATGQGLQTLPVKIHSYFIRNLIQ